MTSPVPIWRCLWIVIVLSVFAMPAGRAADDGDWQTWNFTSVKYLDTEKLDLVAVGQFRFRDDFGDFSHGTLSHRIQFDPQSWLGLSLNYTWLHTLPLGTDEFVDMHRPELEISPRWHGFGLEWELRNRLELRYIEDVDEVRPRLRHRLQATLPLTGLGFLSALVFSDELFYDTTLDRVSENRLLPLALNFKLSPHSNLITGYGVQSFWNNGDWVHSHLIVSTLQITF
ncbi:DUF2490 domain-containing protein [Prosthecobacter sp. SYSU 5D2]|uniref:DUF2490 domain-containing protein n=1 Tax=Prosthecobacter sp. SYSU 5D2 TaxID=3134134 RepID=UPI0031FE49EE